MKNDWKKNIWIGIGIFYLVLGIAIATQEVKRIKALKTRETLRLDVVEVPLSEGVDRSLAGKYIHIVGPLKTGETYHDDALKFEIPVISLVRSVKYWQVEETQEEKTVKDVYGKDSTIVKTNYVAKWVNDPIVKNNATNVLFTLPSTSFTASDVHLGPYRVSKDLISFISKGPIENVDIPFNNFLDAAGVTGIRSRFIEKSGVTMTRSSNTYFFGKDSQNPAVGDVQITFTGVQPGTYSAIALVADDGSLTTGKLDGKTVTSIIAGKRSAEAMMGKFVRSQKKGIWKLRLATLLTLSLFLFTALKDEKFAVLKSVSIAGLAIMVIISTVWLILRFKVGIFLLLFTLLLAGYTYWLFHPKKPTVVIEDGGKPETIDLPDGDGKTNGTGESEGSLHVTDTEEPEVFSLE